MTETLFFETRGDRAERAAALKSRLAFYKERTVRTLLDYVPPGEPRRHLWDLVTLYPLRSGKGFRPAQCMASCAAWGGDPDDALPSAAAIELFHNGFLVHDDIEDGSEERRGEPTLHAMHGVPLAVNVGDAMNVLSIRPLMDNMEHIGPELAWKVFREIEHMVRESVEGQALELGWVRDNTCDLGTSDYLRMILKKTCWYTCMHPLRVGAIIGSAGTVDPERFNRFGYFMGAAFQIQDDLLNLVGEYEKYGKEIGGDILEGKRTLMLSHLFQHATPREHARLRRFLATERASRLESDVRWVLDRMARHGSIDFGRSMSRQLAGAALREFYVAYGPVPDSEDKRFLRDLVLYMIDRDL